MASRASSSPVSEIIHQSFCDSKRSEPGAQHLMSFPSLLRALHGGHESGLLVTGAPQGPLKSQSDAGGLSSSESILRSSDFSPYF